MPTLPLNPTIAASYTFPDGIDWTIGITYLSLAFGLAAFGYVCMALDIRAYLRSLRRALVVISGYRVELPEWVRISVGTMEQNLRCIATLKSILVS